MFLQYKMVRVKNLKKLPEAYNGWNVNRRSPVVGDIGVLVDILHADELPDNYVVELSDAEGKTIWLAEFDKDEIEPLNDTEIVPNIANTPIKNTSPIQRDIDNIILAVKQQFPQVLISQLQKKRPTDDDGIWWFELPNSDNDIQIESTSGMCPFLVETNEQSSHLARRVQTVEQAAQMIVDYLRKQDRT